MPSTFGPSTLLWFLCMKIQSVNFDRNISGRRSLWIRIWCLRGDTGRSDSPSCGSGPQIGRRSVFHCLWLQWTPPLCLGFWHGSNTRSYLHSDESVLDTHARIKSWSWKGGYHGPSHLCCRTQIIAPHIRSCNRHGPGLSTTIFTHSDFPAYWKFTTVETSREAWEIFWSISKKLCIL